MSTTDLLQLVSVQFYYKFHYSFITKFQYKFLRCTSCAHASRVFWIASVSNVFPSPVAPKSNTLNSFVPIVTWTVLDTNKQKIMFYWTYKVLQRFSWDVKNLWNWGKQNFVPFKDRTKILKKYFETNTCRTHSQEDSNLKHGFPNQFEKTDKPENHNAPGVST